MDKYKDKILDIMYLGAVSLDHNYPVWNAGYFAVLAEKVNCLKALILRYLSWEVILLRLL